MSKTDEGSQFTCVLCNGRLESKEALQDHFRKHANKEIDSKGRPRRILDSTASKRPLPQPVLPTSNGSPSGSSNNNSSSSSCSSSNSSSKGNGVGNSGVTCDVCGIEFDSVTLAIQHKFKKHPDSAIKHFCPHCGKQFPLKINRDKHLLTHSGATPSKLFPCQECGVVFYNADAQSYHFRSTHKRIFAFFRPIATPPPSKKIKLNNALEAQSVYYCHLCGFEYIVKFNLQKHLEKQHPEEERSAMPQEMIKCTTCDALFYNKKAYDNHNMYHRPDDLYVTSEQQRLQTVTRVDQDFDIRRVQSTAEKFIPVYRARRAKQDTEVKEKKARSQKSSNKVKKKIKKKEKVVDFSSDSELSNDSDKFNDSDGDSDSCGETKKRKTDDSSVMKVPVYCNSKSAKKDDSSREGKNGVVSQGENHTSGNEKELEISKPTQNSGEVTSDTMWRICLEKPKEESDPAW